MFEVPPTVNPNRDNGKENGNYYIVCWGHIGIMEKKTETTM